MSGADDPSDGPGGRFASRWSRRKRAVRAGGDAPPEAAPVPEASGAAPTAGDPRPEAPDPTLADLPDDEVLRRLGLPDPDQLEHGDDFAAFMARGVPARLRNRALRALWRSDPVLANLDGLIDYAEDYSDAAKAAPNLRTAYQVGKGFVKRVDEIAGGATGTGAQPVASGAEEAETGPAADADAAGPESDPGPVEPPRDDAWPRTRAEAPPEPAPRRRMQFRLPEA
jgi:hypothetical protein